MELTIGGRIRKYRELRGMSQSDLERATKIKREYLSKLETDELDNPTLKTLRKIANGLDFPIEVLVADKQPEESDHEFTAMKLELAESRRIAKQNDLVLIVAKRHLQNLNNAIRSLGREENSVRE